MTTYNVGDINSDARGSGARANTGKPPLELLPLLQLAPLFPQSVRNAVTALGHFQARSPLADEAALRQALIDTAKAAGLSMAELMVSAAHVLDYGRGKYAAFNWAKGMPWSVCIGCAARHLILHMAENPNSVDEESGELHAGHVACNILFLLQYMKTYPEGDDRPTNLRTTP